MAGVYAASARSVYAIGSGGDETVGGPLVVLHYNGTSWRRLALSKTAGGPMAVIPDGKGGLWIPVDVFVLNGRMDHFTRGILSTARLPIRSARLRVGSAAIAPGSTAAFVVGYSEKSLSSSTSTAVILRYGS